LGDTLNGQTIALPPQLANQLTTAQQAWRLRENTRRLWSKDASLWTGRDEGDWLGWLDIVGDELQDIAAVRDFGQELRASGLSDVLLLGMGGSSLGPEVLAKSLGSAPGYPKLRVLDSTDPDQVRRFKSGIDVARTAFIVSSKSGTTLEPNVLMDYFFARVSDAIGDAAGRNFAAITDPGSQLQKTAKDRGFRHVFFGVPSVGGRFSVLS
jgi:transaldolase/glucose-6-phosphate isomerase